MSKAPTGIHTQQNYLSELLIDAARRKIVELEKLNTAIGDARPRSLRRVSHGIEAQLSSVFAVQGFRTAVAAVKGAAAEGKQAHLPWANGKHPFDCRKRGELCGELLRL